MSDLPQHHWYFTAPTTTALRDQLNAAGEAPILRVWKEGDALFLNVESAGEAKMIHFHPLNDSHVCPGSPGCPS